jgi:phosphomevalonate kinase
MVIQASAPGKLMLAGEYVVAAGRAPALAVATGLRATVTVRETVAAGWLVDAPALGLSAAQLADVPILSEVVALYPGLRHGRIEVASDLGAGPRKPGLGGSSAVCVAAARATAAWAERPMASLADLVAAHRRSQGGVGSGYDIAAALHGGVTLYQSSSLTAGPPSVEPLAWPEGLFAAVFFSGRSASTREQLERVSAWRLEDPESYEACIEPLAAETNDFIRIFRTGDVARILVQAAQLQEELAFFDRVGDVGILPVGPVQLAGAIEDAGAVARTAGAGGGDCMWALSDDPALIDAAARAASALGFTRLEVELPGEGAKLHGDAVGA